VGTGAVTGRFPDPVRGLWLLQHPGVQPAWKLQGHDDHWQPTEMWTPGWRPSPWTGTTPSPSARSTPTGPQLLSNGSWARRGRYFPFDPASRAV